LTLEKLTVVFFLVRDMVNLPFDSAQPMVLMYSADFSELTLPTSDSPLSLASGTGAHLALPVRSILASRATHYRWLGFPKPEDF
jgi:hypothetical protein